MTRRGTGGLLALALLLTTLVVGGCGGGDKPKGDYGYLIEMSEDGERHYATRKKRGRPIKHPLVFSADSDPDWLLALRKLRADILYPGADGHRIFLVGDLDIGTGEFALDRWYITTPFFEINPRPGQVRGAKTRRDLRPSDFYVPVNIDLRQAVMDARLAGSREWGGVGAPYTGEEFEFD